MKRRMPTRKRPLRVREESMRLFRAAIAEFGMVVIPMPEYAAERYEELWARDYSALQPADKRVFEWMDQAVDQGEFHRGPYGRGLCYYSKQGTRMYEAGRNGG